MRSLLIFGLCFCFMFQGHASLATNQEKTVSFPTQTYGIKSSPFSASLSFDSRESLGLGIGVDVGSNTHFDFTYLPAFGFGVSGSLHLPVHEGEYLSFKLILSSVDFSLRAMREKNVIVGVRSMGLGSGLWFNIKDSPISIRLIGGVASNTSAIIDIDKVIDLSGSILSVLSGHNAFVKVGLLYHF